MSYQVIARKWRPKLFDDLIGQDHVARTLSNSIQSNRIAHGYLFAGPRGVGKTSTARIFAKALNCPNVKDGQPCNTCSTCIEITNGNGIDVIEIDGASNNSVDNIRDLRENIRFTPTGGRYKIYIIDEVHMLSKGAFNALLKTLEEPPKHAVFIFATTEIHKVLPTILSRCQRFDFKRIPITAIVATLHKICEAESIQVDENGLIQVAKKADGSMRDAQSILDQLISFCGNQISSEDVRSVLGIINQELFFEISQAFIEKNTGKSFSIVESLFQDGFDLTEVIHGLEEHMRHLLVCISTQKADLIDTADDYKQQFLQQAKSYKQMDILRIIEILQKTEQLIRSGNHPRIKLELAFAKICQMDKSVEINKVLNMLGSEKKKPETELIDTKRSESTEPNTFPIKPAIHQPSVTAAEPPIVDKITLVKDLPEQQNQTQTVQVKNSVTSEKNDVVKPEIPALDTNESKESQPIDHAITTAVYDRSD
ncbi:MAG: DNA polymerase III subunit gamma/tau, partial [Calditrichaeota bacterium]|nr:DNA polymerase III subunit gamma/tau [Calditrichota bacterium]